MISRDFMFAPILFSMTGAAIGISIALVTRYEREYDRVYLESSVPLMFLGTLVGGLAGSGVMHCYRRFARFRIWIEIGAVTMLFAAAGAPIGWLAGDRRIGNPPDAMFWGVAVGATLGVATAFVQWFLDKRLLAGRWRWISWIILILCCSLLGLTMICLFLLFTR